MPSTQHRCLILIMVLTAGWGLLVGTQKPEPPATRWPTDEDLFQVSNWQVSPPTVERPYGDVHVLTRHYSSSNVVKASLVVKTDHEAKNIYRAGIELGYQGGGYTVEPAPTDLVPTAPASGALVVSGQDKRWLVLYTHGERRGLLGSGPLAWTLATADGLLGQPGDYYQLTLLSRLDAVDPSSARQITELADILFPRVADWYGTAG
jgi:hypothetical protein